MRLDTPKYLATADVDNPDKYINDMQNNDDPEVAAVVKAMAVYSQKARILFSYKLGELN